MKTRSSNLRAVSLVLSSLGPIAALACGGPPDAVAPTPQASVTAAPPPTVTQSQGPKKPSVDEAVLDKSVSPCDDFYQYACGGWRKATPIPDDQGRWNRSFSVLRQKNEETLKGSSTTWRRGNRPTRRTRRRSATSTHRARTKRA